MQKGFSLIELMIVITIIGVLAAIALPAYQDYVARAQVTEAINLVSGLKSAVSESYGSTGICPDNTNNSVFGLAIPPQIKGNYVSKIEATAGTASNTCQLKAIFKNSDVSKKIQGENFTLVMEYSSGSEVWRCDSSLSNQYLPAACRN